MKIISLLSILLLPVILNAQDLIYAISGDLNEEKVTLNSIHFENISNGTGILFNSLPEADDYLINLTQKSYWGTTSISAFEKPSKFVVSQNTQGKLVVLYNWDQPTDLRISIYNINGQKVYSSGRRILQEKNSIRVQLGLPHLFLVKLETASESQTFKAVGSENSNGFSVEISDDYKLNVLKSTQVDFDNEFSFSIGDSIRISAYKSGYYATPIGLKVTDSQAVNFVFEESQSKNFFKINDVEYVLSGGLLTYFGNFEGKSSLYLLAPGHNINFETLETTGTDGVVLFEIFNAQEDIESGIYNLGTPEEMNADTVCDVDVNNDGLINEQDCVYKLPEGKYYISSQSSVYDDANLHNFTGMEFQSGKVIITRDGDFFTVEFDCIGKNGNVITGFYSGQIHYYDMADEPLETDSFTDSRDGKTYKTVKIGDQWWMAENLAYLPEISNTKSLTDPCYYVYGYQGTSVSEAKVTDNYKTFGVLYNWAATKTVCPSGWHTATDDDWEQLAQFISKEKGGYTEWSDEWSWYNVGEYLKTTLGWNSNNGTNDYGFSGLPGGYRSYSGNFETEGNMAAWWSATEIDENMAWYRSLNSNDNIFYRFGDISKHGGLSIRCVKGTNPTLIDSEIEINDTLLWCYSKLNEYVEFSYLFDAVYSNNYPAPDNSWTEIYEHAQTMDNGKIFRLWTDAFNIIYKTNLILKSAEKAISDPQTRNTIIAQTKAMRAYLFYNLLTWFGEVPIEEGISVSMIPRNSISDVLAQIKQDASEAALYLPMNWTTSDKFRFPRSFAQGLLARTSLYHKDYNEALPPVRDMINSGIYVLNEDPNNFSTTNTEIFCGFEKSGNTQFNNFFSKGSFVPIMRYTEAWLIYAESLVNTGNAASALNLINQINMRRNKPIADSLTDDDLYQHWKTELAKEGSMFITLKRFGKAFGVLQDQEYKFVLPLPLSILINNPYLTQNPGY